SQSPSVTRRGFFRGAEKNPRLERRVAGQTCVSALCPDAFEVRPRRGAARAQPAAGRGPFGRTQGSAPTRCLSWDRPAVTPRQGAVAAPDYPVIRRPIARATKRTLVPRLKRCRLVFTMPWVNALRLL